MFSVTDLVEEGVQHAGAEGVASSEGWQEKIHQVVPTTSLHREEDGQDEY